MMYDYYKISKNTTNDYIYRETPQEYVYQEEHKERKWLFILQVVGLFVLISFVIFCYICFRIYSGDLAK